MLTVRHVYIAIAMYAAITLGIVGMCAHGCASQGGTDNEQGNLKVLSPEVMLAIQQHVQATMRNELTSIKNEATSQPANQSNTTSAGRDAKPVSVNASIHGGGMLETVVFTAGTVAVLYIVLVLARVGHGHLKRRSAGKVPL